MINIVIIDDEYYFRNSLINNSIWEKLDCSIIGDANNGNTGYELIKTLNPEIAIIDINMPGMTGLELIEKLIAEKINCKFILLTGYGEFKYAQKAISYGVKEYILKPIQFDILENSLNKLIQEIQSSHQQDERLNQLERENKQLNLNFILNDLVLGNIIQTCESLSNIFPEFEFHFSFSSFFIILMEFSETPSYEGMEKNKRIAEDFLNTSAKGIVFIDTQKRLCLILHDSTKNKTSFYDKLNSLFSDTAPFSIGISESKTSLEEISLCYNQACSALKQCHSKNTSIEQYTPLSVSSVFLCSQQMKNRLSNACLKQSIDETTQILTLIYTDFNKLPFSQDNLLSLSFDLLSILTECNQKLCQTPEPFLNLKESFYNKILSFKTTEAAKKWFSTLFNRVIKQSINYTDINPVSGKIRQYINRHFKDSSLSIEKIANHFFLNYSYICCCFKKDYDITINDYILQKRIDYAKQLFRSGSVNVGIVAEAIGFNNANYFSKCFKKAVGVSPSAYLKLNS